ncbi:MFS transporter [Rhodanobacter sp. AS-Z3]|uniref:MFS transporter n=1 Tax=Rhodanobacter sp. AS-Z3 TaxID=3031330 RepID=UPI0024795C00|nr:MFS transporter [Rhodanobacter sp. AS-Z3]WEN14097.1 MFS transporter [Rhodanobacter sp. AS-Z3]
MTDPAANSHRYPSAGIAWLMVSVLTLAYVFSFVDRYVLGLLIQPIKADLQLSDQQIGYLLGPAFAIFYATMGLPLGLLADRKRRTWLVAAGVALWSVATAASGLARDFWHLFGARMSVGVGEATLSPAAMSMIGDSFPPERRGKPIAFYSAALTLGAGIASLLGAAVLEWTKTTSMIELPIVGIVKPWQTTFFVVGLPGLLIALGLLFLREPPRQQHGENMLARNAGVGATLRFVRSNAATFACFVSLPCLLTIIAYSQGFLPAVFTRSFGWSAEKYALANGISMLLLGPATVNITGALSDAWTRRGIKDAPLRLIILGCLVMVPTASLAMLMPGPWTAIAMLGLNSIALAMISAVGVTALLAITPAPIRGQIVALYYMAISLAGLLLGPTTVGFLSTHVLGEANLRYAMAAVPLIYGIVPLLLIPVTRRRWLAQCVQMEGST